jgi:hypothetical protein
MATDGLSQNAMVDSVGNNASGGFGERAVCVYDTE